MRRSIKRELLVIFVLVFLITGVVNLWSQFGGGTGTEDDPWQIGRADHLNNIRNYLGELHNDKYFIQTHDIDLGVPPYNEGQGWVPIGDINNRFYGKYNGNGFTVDRMFINRNNVAYQGLFGFIDGAVISNLGVTNVNITGQAYTGAVAARIFNNSLVSNCYSTGNVVGNGNQTGGLVGHNQSNSTVTDSYSECNVRGGPWYTGGVVGLNDNNSLVNNSYGAGEIRGNNQVGGVVGQCQNNSRMTNCYTTGTMIGVLYTGGVAGTLIDGSSMSNCYSVGTVNGGDRAGGLIGYVRASSVTNCYSTSRVAANTNIGGLIGQSVNEPVITESYWDTERSEQNVSPGGGFGRATRQMVYPYDDETYVRWDFDEIWINDVERTLNDGYPLLFFQDVSPALHSPQVSIEQLLIENIENIRISWELIDGARSYRVYTSANPYTDNWGEPVQILRADINQFTQPINAAEGRYFYVTASSEEPPED